jgi:hypothetical protein
MQQNIAAHGTLGKALLVFGALFFVVLAGSVEDGRLSTIKAKAAPILARQCLTLPDRLKADICPRSIAGL